MQESEIFQIARKLPAEERENFLNNSCGEDQTLRKEIEELLHVHQLHEASDKKNSSLSDPDTFIHVPPTLVTAGNIFAGKYRIEKLLGEGGMGAVYLAEQLEPIKRLVAMKIIRQQLASPSMMTRFELEQRAMAMMDHPCIAKVHDAGITSHGTPYFVMEYIQGATFTKCCHQKGLSLRLRIEIMIQVCQAMHHAHQKGVIHRDLKPSNILVTTIDEKHLPKIIDFGTAKLLEGKLTEISMLTEFGALLGTPEYMSPEQAAFDSDIDTRSDIYSLGIILYELLTGSVPFPRSEFEKTGLSGMLRAIRDNEPIKPSAAILKHETKSSTMSSFRSSILRGDLDSIVMKALEKDRDRRYSSAEALAQDLTRYLSNEPVFARPASAGYRLSKFITKNRGFVIAASLLLSTLLAGLVGTTWAMFQAKSHADDADEAGLLARNRLAQLETEKTKLDQQIEISNAIIDFFLIDVLKQSSLSWQKHAKEKFDPNITLRQAILNASKSVEGKFQDQPNLEAMVRRNIGRCLVNIGEQRKATAHFRKSLDLLVSLPETDPVVLQLAKSELANVLVINGQHKEALTLLPEVLKEEERLLGKDEKQTLDTLHRLAAAHTSLGEFHKARELWEELLERRIRKYGTVHTYTIESRTELAYVLSQLGDLQKSLSTLEPDYKTVVQAEGDEHPVSLLVARILALCYASSGQHANAIQLYEKLDLLYDRLHGAEHPETLINHIHRAQCFIVNKNYDEAVDLLESKQKLILDKFGPEHGYTLNALQVLGIAYLANDQDEKAVLLLEKVFEVRSRKYGDNHSETIQMIPLLTMGYWKRGHAEKAIPYCERFHGHCLQSAGVGALVSKMAAKNLSFAYLQIGQINKSLSIIQPVIDELGENLKSTDAKHKEILDQYLDCLEQSGQFEKAETLRRKLVLGLSQGEKVMESHVCELALLARNLNLQKKFRDSEAMINACLEKQENIDRDSWNLAPIRTILAASLTGLKQYEKAEQYLNQASETLSRQRPKAISWIRFNAARKDMYQGFIQLYSAWNKPDKARLYEEKARAVLPTRER